VVESLPRNSGRDRVPVFINRQKVPRAVEPVPRPGDITKHTVLNVFGDLVDGYFILDRLKVISRISIVIVKVDQSVFALRRSYASAVLGVLILSVCPSVTRVLCD